MGFDLSGIDAELSALDPSPHELESLGARSTVALGTLSDVDASLAALESSLDQPLVLIEPVIPRVPVYKPEPRPRSGEINLGKPVQRRSEPSPVSTELTLLDSDRPSSGAFELDDVTARNEDFEVDPFASPKRPRQLDVNPISLSPAGSRAPGIELTPIAIDPLSAEKKIDLAEASSALFSTAGEGEGEPDTIVLSEDRDPDAEFDALFDEATHPSGIPTRNFDADDETLTADDLLSGLTDPNERESEAATNALFAELEAADNTDIIDAKTLEGHLDPFPSEEELGSSEFEIVLDGDGEAKDLVPSRPPEELALGATEKRPSFLGRLFGRKDEK